MQIFLKTLSPPPAKKEYETEEEKMCCDYYYSPCLLLTRIAVLCIIMIIVQSAITTELFAPYFNALVSMEYGERQCLAKDQDEEYNYDVMHGWCVCISTQWKSTYIQQSGLVCCVCVRSSLAHSHSANVHTTIYNNNII